MSFDQVQEFNDTFGVVTRTKGGSDERKVRVREAKLRFKLIKEEFEELLDAVDDCDIVEVVDALGDIRYVVIGAAQAFGIVRATQDIYWSDTNDYKSELASPEIQDQTLKLLRLAILRNDADSTAQVLALILKMVDDAAEFFGVNLASIVDAIHESNMSKLAADGSVIRREGDNKVLKGENYKEPTADIEKLLGFDDVESE